MLTIFSLASNAQVLSYSNGMIDVDGELVQTINIKLDPKPETIRESFEQWMDDNYDVDLDGKTLLFFDKDEMSAEGVVIESVSTRKIDLKVRVNETDSDATILNVYASFGYNNWINPIDYPYEFAALEGIVYEYVAAYLPKYYMEKVANTKEKITDLNDDRSELQEEIDENESDIKDLKEENMELMKKLKKNQMEINSSKSKLTKRNKEYNSIKERVKDTKG